MTICAVNGCSNRSSRRNPDAPSVSFYCLPKVINNQCERTRELSEKRRRLWLEKIDRRELYFKKEVRICSIHFISGKPAYLMHDKHPDWLPTLKLGQGVRTKRSLRSFRSQRAKKERKGKNPEGDADNKEAKEDKKAIDNSQVADERVSVSNNIASHKKVASRKNRQVASSKKVARNIKVANSRRVANNKKKATSTRKAAGSGKAADEKGVTGNEELEVADNTEVAAQGLLELAGVRTREETGLSAVQEWLKLCDGDAGSQQETGVGTQTTLKMGDIVALELELRILRRQLRELREKKPASSSG
ncbi:unnamed protein product [Ixodes hexagonus]